MFGGPSDALTYPLNTLRESPCERPRPRSVAVRGAVTTVFGGLCHVDEIAPQGPHQGSSTCWIVILRPRVDAID